MLKSFRSTDKKGNEGIEFGDEWYKTLMGKIDKASDVVCLLTERSIERPWILYEAGVAKGKLNTPVHGVALGIPLERVSQGPFYQFQNCDDSNESISKLVLQLCKRIPALEPDNEVVKTQVNVFIENANKTLKTIGTVKEELEKSEDSNTAKVLEEMKLIMRELPMRVEQSFSERPTKFTRSFSTIGFCDPRFIIELIHFSNCSENDPLIILIIGSLFSNDFPWLYEICKDLNKSVLEGNLVKSKELLKSFNRTADFTFTGPLRKQLNNYEKESFFRFRDFIEFATFTISKIIDNNKIIQPRTNKLPRVPKQMSTIENE